MSNMVFQGDSPTEEIGIRSVVHFIVFRYHRTCCFEANSFNICLPCIFINHNGLPIGLAKDQQYNSILSCLIN